MGRVDLATMVGLGLLIAYVVQAAIGVPWPILEDLQAEEQFRIWSGAVAAGFVALQWTHPMLRTAGSTRLRIFFNKVHRWLGSAVILAFFVHSTHPGVGYLSLVSVCVLLGLSMGMGQILAEPGSVMSRLLLIGHVTLSVLLVGVLLFHVWVVFAYSPGTGVHPGRHGASGRVTAQVRRDPG